MPKEHLIMVYMHKGSDGKWHIRITGVTSAMEVDFGNGDDGSVKFCLDADRFKPRVQVED